MWLGVKAIKVGVEMVLHLSPGCGDCGGAVSKFGNNVSKCAKSCVCLLWSGGRLPVVS